MTGKEGAFKLEISVSIKCKDQIARMEPSGNQIQYIGETSYLEALGYDLTKPLLGQIITFGHNDGEPLKWITLSLARHSATLISFDQDYYEHFEDNEFLDYLFELSDMEKELLIDPFPWRQKERIHKTSVMEDEYYLAQYEKEENYLGFRDLRMVNEANGGLIIHLDIHLLGNVSGLGEYKGQKMNWLMIDQTYRGIELLSETVTDEKFYFHGEIKDWKQSEGYRWLNTEFLKDVFSEEELHQLEQYEKQYSFDFFKAGLDSLNGYPWEPDEHYWSGKKENRTDSEANPQEMPIPAYCSLLTAEEVMTTFEKPKERIAKKPDGTVEDWLFIDKVDFYSEIPQRAGAHGWNVIDKQGDFYAASWDQGFGYYLDFHWSIRPTVMLSKKASKMLYL